MTGNPMKGSPCVAPDNLIFMATTFCEFMEMFLLFYQKETSNMASHLSFRDVDLILCQY